MKTKTLIILFFGLLFYSCESGTEPEVKQAKVFEIHLQSSYNKTPVQVIFDSKIVLNDTISTGSILAYAAIIPLKVSQGKHKMRAIINNIAEAETLLIVGDSLYATVNYNPENNTIYFGGQTWPFPYK